MLWFQQFFIRLKLLQKILLKMKKYESVEINHNPKWQNIILQESMLNI